MTGEVQSLGNGSSLQTRKQKRRKRGELVQSPMPESAQQMLTILRSAVGSIDTVRAVEEHWTPPDTTFLGLLNTATTAINECVAYVHGNMGSRQDTD